MFLGMLCDIKSAHLHIFLYVFSGKLWRQSMKIFQTFAHKEH